MTDDLAEAIVKAALERAARVADKKIFHFTGHWAGALLECEFKKILDLASDPAEVAAIISAASQLNKAGDEIKEQRDEEDRDE
jgi:surfactin synthase thioesterase subunit